MLAQLEARARPQSEPAAEAAELLGDILARIARSYTMASEREVHRRFAPADEASGPAEAGADIADDDDDDGLF
jgi:hypothetical protein